MKAIKDLIYMIGLWFIGRVSRYTMGDLLEQWGIATKEQFLYDERVVENNKKVKNFIDRL